MITLVCNISRHVFSLLEFRGHIVFYGPFRRFKGSYVINWLTKVVFVLTKGLKYFVIAWLRICLYLLCVDFLAFNVTLLPSHYFFQWVCMFLGEGFFEMSIFDLILKGSHEHLLSRFLSYLWWFHWSVPSIHIWTSNVCDAH